MAARRSTWFNGQYRQKYLWNRRIGLDPVYSLTMERHMSSEPFLLNAGSVRLWSRGTKCLFSSGIRLSAIHVRTNHAHIVSSAQAPPDQMMAAFKANATRELREAGLFDPDQRVWSRGGSTKYLWKPSSVERAIDYTINGQGDDLPDF